MSLNELLKLLEESRSANAETGITGMLINKGWHFAQLIEGEYDAIHKLYEKIRVDDRHTDVVTILAGKLSERLFPDWTMGFEHMRFLHKAGIEGLNKVFTDESCLASRDPSHPAIQVLSTFRDTD